MTHDRVAGVLVPLFSMPSTGSWGIGEFADIPIFARWMREAGVGLLQLLPLNETDWREQSPYSALSAMALDPQFITMRDVEDLAALGGEEALPQDTQQELAAARQSRPVEYPAVRAAKLEGLKLAFDRFFEVEWNRGTARARALERYIADQSWWLKTYTLYRAIRTSRGEVAWTSWGKPLRELHREALETARQTLFRERLFYEYVQWTAERQWQAARHASRPLQIFGDYPFLPTTDSADVWWRQEEFDAHATVGAPPDGFNPEGQNWGLPPCRWDVMASRGDDWTRQRLRRMADLYDGLRMDHLVGFYRTYIWPRGASSRPRGAVVSGELAHGTAAPLRERSPESAAPRGQREAPYFTPQGEEAQLAQGERIMRIALELDSYVSVEDLGTIPDFVRASVARLGLPGYKVLRWEREWQAPGRPFRNPAEYPRESVAATGTHDTDTLAGWWPSVSNEDRALLAGLAVTTDVTAAVPDLDGPTFDGVARDLLLQLGYASASDVLIVPIQDVFGWTERINVPGTPNGENWTYKLPWPVDDWMQQPETVAAAEQLRAWAERYDRRPAMP